MVQFSQPHVTTGKTIALTIQTVVSKVMSLLFNTLSKFVRAFLPRSIHLLISWLQSPSTVISEPRTRKSVTASTFSPSICHEVMRLDAMLLVFLTLNFLFGLINFYWLGKFKNLSIKKGRNWLAKFQAAHYTDGKTEVQEGNKIFPRSLICKAGGLCTNLFTYY